MNSRERVLTAVNHQEPDRIPLDLGAAPACMFTLKFYQKLLNYLGINDPKMLIVSKYYQLVLPDEAVMKKLGTDVRLGIFFPKAPHKTNPLKKDWEDEKNFFSIDDWGITRRMPKDPGYYYDIISSPFEDKEEDEDANMFWPELAELDENRSYAFNKNIHDGGYFNNGGYRYTHNIFQWATLVYGYQHWYEMLVLEPERCDRFMSKLVDLNLEGWRRTFACKGSEFIDCAMYQDDFGTQRGPFISLDMYKKRVFPYHKRLFEGIKKMKPGIKICLHSCGSIAPLIPYFIEEGVDILNPVQISADNMEPEVLKREYGKDITFYGGGISTQYTLPHGTKQEIIDEVKRNIDILAPGGGFIFTPVHDIQPDVPVENFMIMLETFMKYANY